MIPIGRKGKFEKPRGSAADRAAARTTAAKKKKKRSLIGPIIVIVLVVLIGLAAGGVYYYGTQLKNSDTIFPNVYLYNVNVGGMTAEEATAIVENAATVTTKAKTLQVQLADRTLTFDPTQTSVALDTDQAVAQAMAYGKDGNAFATVLAYSRSNSNRVDLDLTTSLNLDTDYIRSIIDRTAEEVARDLIPSSVSYDQRLQQISVQTGVPSQWLDADGLYEAVCKAYSTGNMETIEWEYGQELPDQVDLTSYHENFCSEPEDAWYDAENHTIVDAKPGLNFDLADAQRKLENTQYGAAFTVSLEAVEAELQADALYEQMFGTKLESRSSRYWAWQVDRTKNLEIACAGINGTIINPGEVFSFNEILGERTEEKGYRPATVFGGEGNMAAGGGICQVASTIFYAALYLDLETVMRYPHSYTVDYVPLGMDAAIYWDDGQDYKFRNNRENPILIEANIDNDHVNITFWGVKENDNYVVMTFEVLEEWEDEDEEQINEDRPAGYRESIQAPYTGRKVNAHQSVFDGNGNLIKTKTYYSYYYSRPRIWEVSPDMATPEYPEEYDPYYPEYPYDPEEPEDPEEP